MMATTFFAIDASLGRFNIDDMSDQMRMELLVESFPDTYKEMIQEDGAYKPISEWSCVALDEEGNVTRVEMYIIDAGKIAFEFIPKTVKKFWLGGGSCLGSVETAALPPDLDNFDISRCKISGTFDMTTLPSGLKMLSISHNNLSGSCALDKLPAVLVQLSAQSNAFSGSITLESLPAGLCHLELSQNMLSGSVSFEKLPDSLVTLDLASNMLCGTIDMLQKFPRGLAITTRIYEGNNFTILNEAKASDFDFDF